MLTLARYIGNKGDLLGPILAAIASRTSPGDLVCDAFSGTLAVSLALKRRGYRVAANDINLMSAVFGAAYLTSDSIPAMDVAALVGEDRRRALARRVESVLAGLVDTEGYAFLDDEGQRAAYARLLVILEHLASLSEEDLPADVGHSYIFDFYCANGMRSEFVSSRGSRGRRGFFSAANARRIDLILNQLRAWHRVDGLGGPALAMLLAVLLSAVEKVSNTQGTYHDFPRGEPDPRASRPLVLVPPALDGLLGGAGGHILGVERDSLEWVREVPHHKVLYLDPPYNFRQYTAYYFLLNVLARYVDIDDLEAYFGGVRYVRGQNPTDDFTSTFSSPRLFVASLETLIERADTEWVILSYFNGRNHWGEFKSDATDTIGYAKMSTLFTSGLFRPGSLEVIPIPRMNYQSYGGHRAKVIDEYLFIGEKTG